LACFQQHPSLILRLDRVARRYGTDPGSVLEWSPFRLGLAFAALDASQQIENMQIQRNKDSAMAVVVLNQ